MSLSIEQKKHQNLKRLLYPLCHRTWSQNLHPFTLQLYSSLPYSCSSVTISSYINYYTPLLCIPTKNIGNTVSIQNHSTWNPNIYKSWKCVTWVRTYTYNNLIFIIAYLHTLNIKFKLAKLFSQNFNSIFSIPNVMIVSILNGCNKTFTVLLQILAAKIFSFYSRIPKFSEEEGHCYPMIGFDDRKPYFRNSTASDWKQESNLDSKIYVDILSEISLEKFQQKRNSSLREKINYLKWITLFSSYL